MRRRWKTVAGGAALLLAAGAGFAVWQLRAPQVDALPVRYAPLVRTLKSFGCRVSLFADADAPELARAAECGADRIELYTGPYAAAHARGDRSALDACAAAAHRAQAAGLAVNAGHDLSQANLGDFVAAVPGVAEVSIGHALIGEALYAGLETTVQRYLHILAAGDGPRPRG